MIDLSPQPQDKASGTAELHPGPRHDPTSVSPETKLLADPSRWPLAHERAEAAIQLVSRWSGPAAMVVVLAGVAWFFIR